MKSNILIVDDTPINRRILKFALEKFHYPLLEAENGLKAIEIVEQETISLIILDLLMPEMDGFQFLEWIKNDSRYNNIPVIVSSALSDAKYIEKALALGAYDYFTKPLKPDILNIQLPLKTKNAIEFYNVLQTTIMHRNQILKHKEILDEELMLASELQHALLPGHLPQLNSLGLAAEYLPSTRLCGDFYDINQKENFLQIIIADVSGHGTPAALLTATLKSLFHNQTFNSVPSNIFLSKLNNDICDIVHSTDYFITALILDIDFEKQQLTISNAGHPVPIIYHTNSNQFEEIELPSYFLGIQKDLEYDSINVDLQKEDIILLYTDGITEAKNDDRVEFGKSRLKEQIEKYKNYDSADILDKIIFGIKKYIGKTKIEDDITLMLLKFDN